VESVVVRYRKAVVVSGVALAVAEVAISPIEPVPVYVACAGIGAPLIVAAIVDGWRHNRHPPAAFVVDARDRSFRTPRLANGLFWPLAVLQIVAAFAAVTASEAAHGRFFWPGAAAVLLFGTLLAGQSLIAWRGTGLILRPDGITADKSFGSLVIPWEALVADRPVPGDTWF
jgi:hypothetical protein